MQKLTSAIQSEDWGFAGGLTVHKALSADLSAVLDCPLATVGWISDQRSLNLSVQRDQNSSSIRHWAFKI